MARAALNWSLDDLAKASEVSRRTITRFEAGETVIPEKVADLRKAFEHERICFIDTGQFAGAVYLMR